jgi:hypothetical protein
MLMNYGALILSFLGGIRWGAELKRADGPDAAVLACSVAPQLVAWCVTLAAPLIGLRLSLVTLIVAFAAQGLWDMNAEAFPLWMTRLRATLSIGAILALLAAVLIV